ncbi:MAG: tetratricopeptide repeat protein [Spirochaetales bacterium]|nr:tetratricopeptide repeat protein [Spirochaetales bacterium]
MRQITYYITILIILNILTSCATIKTKSNIASEYYVMGNQYFELENYDKAIESYKKALDYDKTLTDVNINLVLAYQIQKKYAEAEKIIMTEYSDKQDNYNKNLLLLMGNNYFFQEKFDYAIKVLKTYCELYPTDENGTFNLALAYNRINDDENFLKYLLETYNIKKTFPPALYNLGNYYYSHEDYDNAMEYYHQLVEVDKNNPESFYRLGLLEYKLDEYDFAKEHFQKCIELDKENPQYYLEIAKIYAKGYKDKKSTLVYIEKALENNFKDMSYLQTQEEFELLKEFTEFEELLEKYNLLNKK